MYHNLLGSILGSILGPLLLLIYINDLQLASDMSDPIMFADDTNLFFSHRDINALFLKVNNELHKINQWFISNKLSLNIKKIYIYSSTCSISTKKTFIFL